MLFKTIYTYLIFIFCINLTFCQTKLSKKQVQDDILYLKKKLIDLHPGLYFYSDSSTYNALIDSVYNATPDQTMPMEAYRQLLPIVTGIKDLHTGIYSPIKASKNSKVFPFVIRRFDGKYFIHLNGSTDSTIVRTSEIHAVNQYPISDLVLKLSQQLGYDNGNELSRNYYAVNRFYTLFNKYYGSIDSVSITYSLPNTNQLITKFIKTQTPKIFEKTIKDRYKSGFFGNFNYRIVDSLHKSAVITLTSFTKKGNFLDILQFNFNKKLKQSFSKMKIDSIKNLAIDMRGNGGGFIPNPRRLLRYLAKTPFSVIDSTKIKPKAFFKLFPVWTGAGPIFGALKYHKKENGYLVMKNRVLNKVNPRKNAFNGKVFMLADGGSYSATCMTLSLASDQNLAKIIGTRAAGVKWGSFAGSWNKVILPNSKVKVRIPLTKIKHSFLENVSKTTFIEPDFQIEQSFDDFLERKDTVIEYFKSLSKQ